MDVISTTPKTEETRVSKPKTGRAAATRLLEAVEKLAPITGVSVGKIDDKTTWRIDFAEEATEEEKQAALSALDLFDLSAADTAYTNRMNAAANLREVAKNAKATQAQFLTALKDAIANDLFDF